jgi:D-inositol-3-phosphate glycosyltransferase
MVSSRTRVALVSMHTSPTARAGTVDAGGMNTYILAVATELAARGVEVDLLTRATGAPAVHAVADGVTLCELRAGPPGPLAKDDLVAVTDEFGEAVAELAGRGGPGYDVIHAHYWLSGLATLPVAFELGLPENFAPELGAEPGDLPGDPVA